MSDPPNKFSEPHKSFEELERGVLAALETYSNIHRGSGHNSVVTTHLFEQARDIVLEYLGLRKGKYVVIFCTPRGSEIIKAQLESGSFQSVSSQDTGLSLGVRALVVRNKVLPRGMPARSGGGTARLVARGWVIWATGPGKFEAGTPAIINVIAFVRALRLIKKYGFNAFRDYVPEKMNLEDILYHDELDSYSGQELLQKLKETFIGRQVMVPTLEGVKPFINMDNGASTPTFKPIWDTVCYTWRQSKPVQQKIILEVRSICARLLGAPLKSFDMIFTSNTTEAINLVTESYGKVSEQDVEPVVLNTLLEHNSNDLPWRMIPGMSLIRMSIDSEGFLDMNELETLLRDYNQNGRFGKKRIKLVTLSGASNVLGVFNDLKEISRIVHTYGARLLVDAAQLVAHRKVEMEVCEIDYLAFSAHKAYAPFGCGVLMVKKGHLNLSSSELEFIQTSGEENAVGISALGKALLLLERIGLDIIQEEEQALTGRVLTGLGNIDGLRIHGIIDPTSSRFTYKGGVVAFNLKSQMSDKTAKQMAELGGIGVRFGCHCAHILVKHILGVSHGLERFQRLLLTLFPSVNLPGVTRVSLGIENTEVEVDALIEIVSRIASQSGKTESRHPASIQQDIPIITQAELKKQLKEFTMSRASIVYSG